MLYLLAFPVICSLIVLGVFVTVIRDMVRSRNVGSFRYESRKRLLSGSELNFFQALRSAVPTTVAICPKVQLGEVIDLAGHATDQIQERLLDFVLIDASTGEILAAIDLDATTQEERHFLNEAFNSAGVRLVRIPPQAVYDASELQKRLFDVVEKLAA